MTFASLPFPLRGVARPVPLAVPRSVRTTVALLFVASLVAVGLLLLATDRNEPAYPVLLVLALVQLFALAMPGVLLSMRTRTAGKAARERISVGEAGANAFTENKAALVGRGDAMLAATRRADEPLTMVLFDQSDLLEVKTLFGAGAADRMIGKLSDNLHRLAGSKGLAVRTGTTVFAVLLPGLDQQGSLDKVRRLLGSTCAIEAGSLHDEILLMPDFLARTVGPDVKSIRIPYQAMRTAMKDAQEAQPRRQR